MTARHRRGPVGAAWARLLKALDVRPDPIGGRHRICLQISLRGDASPMDVAVRRARSEVERVRF